jgi:hypothetical protein
MSSVQLPRLKTAPPSGALAGAIRGLLREKYDVELPIIPINDELYARLSAHIYYEIGDYQVAIDAILRLDEAHGAELRERIAAANA